MGASFDLRCRYCLWDAGFNLKISEVKSGKYVLTAQCLHCLKLSLITVLDSKGLSAIFLSHIFRRS